MSVRGNLYTVLKSHLVTYGVVSAETKVYESAPEPLPLGDAPIVVMDVDEPEFEYWSMGTGGTVAETYNIVFRLYLGAEDMNPTTAQQYAYDYADKWREALFNMTSSLAVWDTTPLSGTNNIRTYRDVGEAPYLEYTLQVTETRARNASAS